MPQPNGRLLSVYQIANSAWVWLSDWPNTFAGKQPGFIFCHHFWEAVYFLFSASLV